MADVVKLIKKTGPGKKRAKRIEQGNGYDLNATLNYSQFLAKVIDVRKDIKDEHLQRIFKQIDSENSGAISQKTLDKFFKRKGFESANE